MLIAGWVLLLGICHRRTLLQTCSYQELSYASQLCTALQHALLPAACGQYEGFSDHVSPFNTVTRFGWAYMAPSCLYAPSHQRSFKHGLSQPVVGCTLRATLVAPTASESIRPYSDQP